ncbi:hypothetical protein [Sphingomonas sp. M1-B02]|uniref:hypothetical protein n=1 Tax=Sphingomonas sp. M1-B02 TaxID=3114300 RepID=UPI00223F78C0|nr:hypothetical protein [Sphingomonas sp. S6-11]UZK65114.1 hypothetical protein OKW87_11375 [Sphingomonas sp. S6-11]
MRRLILAATALSLVATSAQAMSVAEFLAKAHALKAKGMAAMFSSDVGLLKREMKTIADAYRADLVSARAAGRKPHSCPPPKGQAKIGSGELLADLERIPPARRGISMKTAFYAFMQRRYPCR